MRFQTIALLAAISLTAPAAGRSRAAIGVEDDELRPLLAQLEQAVKTGDAGAYQSLLSDTADRGRADEFTTELRRGVSRVAFRERDRQIWKDAARLRTGYRLVFDAFMETGATARLTTWRFDLTQVAAGRWAIDDEQRLSSVDPLYRVSVNPSRQFDVKNFRITAEDLELSLEDGSVFTVDGPKGKAELVLLGSGLMSFHPAPEAERHQVRIFSGSESVESRFDAAFVRLGDTGAHADLSTLTPRAVDPRTLRRAEQVLREEAANSAQPDLSDLTDATWFLPLEAGDVLAEIRTRRFNTLTYARVSSQPEDLSLVDRRQKKVISTYTSKERLAARGVSYGDDDGAAYDVLNYDVQAAVAPERQWIEGRATLSLRMRSSGVAQVTLRLGDSLVVDSSVTDAFGTVSSLRVRGQNLLVVSLPKSLPAGAALELTVAYRGRLAPDRAEKELLMPAQPAGQPPPQQPTLMDELQAKAAREASSDPTAFLRAEPNYLYSSGTPWYPQAQSGGYATATLRLSVPAAFACVATGEPSSDSPAPIAGQDNGDPRQLFTFVATRPIRYLSFIVSRLLPANRATIVFDEDAGRDSLAKNAPLLSGDVYKSVALTVQTSPRLANRGREALATAAAIHQFYQSIVGDAPYRTLDVALLEDVSPGGIGPAYFAVVRQPVPNSPSAWRDDPMMFTAVPDFVLAHEAAHQWWGQAVGWRNYHEQWLSEGLAQYFAALYTQHGQGDEALRSILRQMRKVSLEQSDQGPVYLGSRVGGLRGDLRAFRAVVYDKAAAVLHMLRRLMGDDAFFKGMRRFYVNARFRNVGTDDFRQAMEAEADRPLARFFDRWIFGSTVPRIKFTYRVERSPAGQELAVHIEQIGDVFDLPVTVTVQYADRRTVNIVVPVTERVVDKRIPLDGPIRSVEVSKDDGMLAEVVN